KEDEKKARLTATGATDRNGYAVLNFAFPPTVRPYDVELSLTATRGVLTVKAMKDVTYYGEPNILVFTDKPIYQPGQTIHIRALVLSSSKHALPNESLNLKIKDPEDSLLYETDLNTSRFGVTNTDWEIPATSHLGEYK